MKKFAVIALSLAMAVLLAPAGSATAASRSTDHPQPTGLTLAVYGDAPYGTTPTDTAQLDATPGFIASVNADPDVSLVTQIGDIHSGKQFCTQAYDQSVYDLWTKFADPLVYTPGDNETTDCHKVAEGGGLYNPTTQTIDYVLDANGNPVDYAKGNPAANLALIRSIFFARPGLTLGAHKKLVLSQSFAYDRSHPSDRKFVENVAWYQAGIVFVTINLPGGSNNDTDVWYGTPTESPAQTQAREERTGADLRWLDTAFSLAKLSHAKGVVIGAQADMWDPEKGAAHQAGYEPFVASVASHTASLGKPVLMLNGDSHVYRSDNPLSSTASCTWELATACTSVAYIHPGYEVANFHRIVVHGSTFPFEYLRVAINTRHPPAAGANSFGPFSWERIQPS